MKNLALIISILITALALQACGSSSKKTTEPTTITGPTTPVTPEAIHHIQPENVAEYIDDTFYNLFHFYQSWIFKSF